MKDTALSQSMAIDRDRMAAKRSADILLNLLRDFIPDHSRRDAWDAVAEACYKEGMELTTKQMRKEYEAWKELQIEGAHLMLNPAQKP